MPKNISVDEIKAVAGAAVTTRHAADAAKKAWETAAGTDEESSLKAAYDLAETAAEEAKSKADALSQDHAGDPDRKRKVEKLKRKQHFIAEELRTMGESDDDDLDDDDLDEEDLDKPVTRRDLQKIDAKKASQSALQMADAITDPVAKEAVKSALKRVTPSGDADVDFRDAVAIANSGKNSKILEEIGRRVTPPQHRSGAGAPARKVDEEFVPTTTEAGFMRAPFNLSKEDIIKARSGQ